MEPQYEMLIKEAIELSDGYGHGRKPLDERAGPLEDQTIEIKETRVVDVIAEGICDCSWQSTTPNSENGVLELATLSTD